MRPACGLVLPILLAGASLACASAGAARRSCELAPADSVFIAGGTVFRDCAVDHRAQELSRASGTERIDFRPSGTRTCYSAVVEFVVDETGAVETGTARVVRASDPDYGAAVLASLGRWRYRPAQKNGVPVRQIVRASRSIGIAIGAVGSGAPRRPPRC